MLTDMLAVYRQNCDLRTNVNNLLQIIQQKDEEVGVVFISFPPEIFSDLLCFFNIDVTVY